MIKTEELALKQTRDMEYRLSEQVKALSWSREKICDFRQTRLRQLLHHAKLHSSWYREQLKNYDIDQFTEEKLNQLPVLTKPILMENWDNIVTHPALSLEKVEKHIENMLDDPDLLYFLDHYHVIATSGSSGKRGVFVYDWDEWNLYYLMFRRFKLFNENRQPISLNATKKITIGVVAASSQVHGMYSLAQTYKVRNSETFHFPITLPIEEIVAGLNRTQPDVLQGAPSTLYKLCREVEQGRLHIQPLVISVGGEAFYSLIREALETSWPGASIFNSLGTSEGLAGVTCTANRKEMHLNDDLCIVEPVDVNGQRVDFGVLSEKIYMTNLFNYTLPLIRYEITDRIMFLDKQCDCGVNHQLIAEPQSRIEFDFVYEGDIFIHHVTFVSPLLHDKNIREYQIIQTERGVDINILTTGSVDIKKLREIIVDRLKVLGLKEPVVNFIHVEAFVYPFSGKLKRFVALEKA
jgi:phenylacetate-CoA ligase